VQRVVAAQAAYPNLRFSFTVGTSGGNASPSLNGYGTAVLQAVATYKLTNYTINLMTMDYGSATPGNCTMGANGQCEMGASAVQAAINLHTQLGVPYKQIEVTAMIGGNDSANETFTIADAVTLSTFVTQNGLAGLHYWSFDRDVDCAPGTASPTCNTYGMGGTLGFNSQFIASLGL
jgi:chitinase